MNLAAHDLSGLKSMSARIGRDPLLIQGAGGNSSVKIEGVLWVKASGTWLQDAERTPIFLPLDLAQARQRFAAGEEKIAPLSLPGAPTGLFPSIETSLHAFLPQAIVLHVHSVNALAWCVRREASEAIGRRLDGVNWAWLAYRRPGLPLALEAAALTRRNAAPDVLLLGNHGLVVAGPNCEQVEELLGEVERRLHLDPRPSPAPQTETLDRLAKSSPYRPASNVLLHGIATDPKRLAIARAGSLYPDHVVFLGPGTPALGEDETPAGIARDADQAGVSPPALLMAPGRGALLRIDLPPEAAALAQCLGEVLARLPENAEVSYIGATEEQALLGWDAETYRKSLKRPVP